MLKEIIDSTYPISSNSLNELDQLIEIIHIKKGETFIQNKRINDQEYFLLEGIVRSYLISPEEQEVTISFFTSTDILSPNTIRTNNGRSIYNFQTLVDCKLAIINASKFETLMIENIEIRTFGNTVMRNELMLKVHKEVGLASLSAKERLLRFRERYPCLKIKSLILLCIISWHYQYFFKSSS